MTDSSGSSSSTGPLLDAIPLFPLPNVVLFPRAILPLHIFEARYKQMTADALAGDRRIAMALLKPGWETNYYGRAPIEPVVCAGTIVSHEKLPEGTYNLLLQGTTRARVVKELTKLEKPYRVAEVHALEEVPVFEIDLEEQRKRMLQILSEGALSRTSLARQFRQMLSGALSTADIADVMAFHLLDDLTVKQSLLCEQNARTRVERAVEELHKFQRMLGPALSPDQVRLN